jgi:hypothetical protein
VGGAGAGRGDPGGAEAYRRLTGGLDVRPTLSGKLATALEFILVSFTLADLALELGLDAGIEPFVQDHRRRRGPVRPALRLAVGREDPGLPQEATQAC